MVAQEPNVAPVGVALIIEQTPLGKSGDHVGEPPRTLSAYRDLIGSTCQFLAASSYMSDDGEEVDQVSSAKTFTFSALRHADQRLGCLDDMAPTPQQLPSLIQTLGSSSDQSFAVLYSMEMGDHLH